MICEIHSIACSVPQVSVTKIVLIPAIGNFNGTPPLRITDSNQTGRRHRMFWQLLLGHNTRIDFIFELLFTRRSTIYERLSKVGFCHGLLFVFYGGCGFRPV
jgi:hypothetical protein